ARPVGLRPGRLAGPPRAPGPGAARGAPAAPPPAERAARLRRMTLGPTARELMVAAAAREIRDGERVFVGMRLPILAFALAQRTHAPAALGLFENGLVRATPADLDGTLYTMSDPPTVVGALWSTTTANIMGLLEQAGVDPGLIGAAAVDRSGRLNPTY